MGCRYALFFFLSLDGGLATLAYSPALGNILCTLERFHHGVCGAMRRCSDQLRRRISEMWSGRPAKGSQYYQGADAVSSSFGRLHVYTSGRGRRTVQCKFLAIVLTLRLYLV